MNQKETPTTRQNAGEVTVRGRIRAMSVAILTMLAVTGIFHASIANNTSSQNIKFYEETVEFNPPQIEKDPSPAVYDQIRIDGCQRMTSTGLPALPVKIITLKLGLADTVLDIKVEPSTYKLGGTYHVSPSPRPSLDTTAIPLTEPDQAIYSADRPYPGTWYDFRFTEGMDAETLRRVKFLTIYLYPVQYNPVSGELEVSDRMKITVSFEQKKQLGDVQLAPSGTKYDLLIITSPALYYYASKLANYKNSIGIASFVIVTEEVYENYDGRDNPEKIRNCIKYFVSEHDIDSVLIFGDADQVPARYAYIPDGYSGDGDLVETDLYYADLQYTWDDNNDGRWGDLNHDQVDGVPDVFIGRLPVSLIETASGLLNKLMLYETRASPYDPWFNRVLLLGTDPFPSPGAEGEILCDYIAENFVWSNFTIDRQYRTYGNQSISSIQQAINDGYGFVNYAGHGNTNCWHLGENWWIFPIEYTSNDAWALRNEYRLPIIFTMACLTSQFADYDCIGEYFVGNPSGGAVAYFGATRVAWGYLGQYIADGLAGEMAWRFNKAFFEGRRNPGAIWAQAIGEYVYSHPIVYLSNGYYLDWKTVAEYSSPFADPTLAIGGRRNRSTVYTEAAYNKPKIAYGSPVSWSKLADASSLSGIVVKASASDSSGSWLYGPYISSTWDGENMRGKPYVASFRLRVSSNALTSNVTYIDVSSSSLGSVLQSKVIRTSDFAAPNVWQDFNLTFITPDLLTSGIEFRVENLNNGVTDVYVDRITVYRGWNAPTVYVEAAYNKPKIAYGNPVSWFRLTDASSYSGIVLKAAASSTSGSWLYGPYIKTGLDGQSLQGKSLKAAFRLKVLSNLRTDNVAYIDVSCEQGTVILNSKTVRASDFASADSWQDFQLTFTVPSSLTYGLEFRMVNLNNGVTDVSVDTITVNTT